MIDALWLSLFHHVSSHCSLKWSYNSIIHIFTIQSDCPNHYLPVKKEMIVVNEEMIEVLCNMIMLKTRKLPSMETKGLFLSQVYLFVWVDLSVSITHSCPRINTSQWLAFWFGVILGSSQLESITYYKKNYCFYHSFNFNKKVKTNLLHRKL